MDASAASSTDPSPAAAASAAGTLLPRPGTLSPSAPLHSASSSDTSNSSPGSSDDDECMQGGGAETLLGGKAFERIRMVGRGAFGTAVLYRRTADDALVVVKEVNLSELKPHDRLLAQNEVRVLSLLDHPNIIGYFDAHREGELLRIEMEYADGGNLAQWVAQRKEAVAETQILRLFKQVLLGMEYVHSNRVLHRDLKSANIFLTVKGVPKIGDFGISRVITTLQKAVTVVGTPYYVSPELCKGLPYDAKSDVWSLGCVLYELCARRLPFAGDNLPALVSRIMQGAYDPLPPIYSSALASFLALIFTRQPERRPGCTELLAQPILRHVRVPRYVTSAGVSDPGTGATAMRANEHGAGSMGPVAGAGGTLRFNGTGSAPSGVSSDSPRVSQSGSDPAADSVTAALFQPALGGNAPSFANAESSVFFWNTADAWPERVRFGRGLRVVQVACGVDHCLALNSERQVFAWGGNAFGQLGAGHTRRIARPVPLEELASRSIVHVAAGGHLSAFLSENGLLSTCGHGADGALGHGTQDHVTTPRLVEDLMTVEVVHIAVGVRHMVAITSDAAAYTWGMGERGQLGLPGGVRATSAPLRAPLPDKDVRAVRAFAGPDASLILSARGRLFACGDNRHNKLALNPRFGLLGLRVIEMADRFTLVKLVGKGCVLDAAVGADVTCAVMDSGKCYTMGNNAEGALGTGTIRPRDHPSSVKPVLREYASQLCAVGSGFVMVAAMPADDPWLHLGQDTTLSTSKRTTSDSGDSSVPADQRPVVLPRQDLFAWGAGFMGIRMEDVANEVDALALPNKVCITVVEEDDSVEADGDEENEEEEEEEAEEEEKEERGENAEQGAEDASGLLAADQAGKASKRTGLHVKKSSRLSITNPTIDAKEAESIPAQEDTAAGPATGAARQGTRAAASGSGGRRHLAVANPGEPGTRTRTRQTRIVGSASLTQDSSPQLISSIDAEGSMIVFAIDLEYRGGIQTSSAAGATAASAFASGAGSDLRASLDGAGEMEGAVAENAEESAVPPWLRRELEGPVLAKPPSFRGKTLANGAAASGVTVANADAEDVESETAGVRIKQRTTPAAGMSLNAFVGDDKGGRSSQHLEMPAVPVIRDNSFNEVVDDASEASPLPVQMTTGYYLTRRGATLTRHSHHSLEDPALVSPTTTGTITLTAARTTAPSLKCVWLTLQDHMERSNEKTKRQRILFYFDRLC